MKKLLSLLALVLAAASAAYPASANAPAQHATEDVTGDEIVCGSTTYTVTSGVLAITMHEGASGSGNANFTVTIVPRSVVLEDVDGNVYSIHGAEWIGGTFNAQQGTFQFTDTDFFTIAVRGRSRRHGSRGLPHQPERQDRRCRLRNLRAPRRGIAARG